MDDIIQISIQAYVCSKKRSFIEQTQMKEIIFMSDKYIKGKSIAIVIDEIEFYVNQDQIEKILEFIKSL